MSNKVDLTLLKKLSLELENHLKAAENMTANEYIIEMSRAVGLASGIAQEATCLIGDIALSMRDTQSAQVSDDILNVFKIKGNGSN